MWLHNVIVLICIFGISSAVPAKNTNHLGFKPAKRVKDGRLGIFDGKTTTIDKHPYVVGIVSDDEVYCAGAIVSDSWVVTDGDCLYGLSKSDLTVVVGSNDGTTGTSYSVKKLVQHPDYDYDGYSYDFGLIKIKGTFTWSDTVGNVSLPGASPADNTAMVVVGYGDTSELTSSSSSSLRQGTMKWLDNSTCEAYYEDIFGWSETEGCAYNKGKTTLCDGDGGDPFVKNGVLYGVFIGALTSNICTSSAYPVILANIYPVVDWIQKYTGATIAYD